MTRKLDFLISVSIFAFVLIVFYAPRTAPSVLFEPDSAEFQVLGYYLGIPHATGYPVYIWILKLMSYLPVGSVAYRANLFSAMCGAAVAAMLYMNCLLAQNPQTTEDVRRWSACTASIVVAYTYTLWNQSIRAEVYTLHALLCMAILYFLLRWWRQDGFGNLVAAAFLCGMGLGHHRQIVSIFPAIALFLVLGDRSRISRKQTGILAVVVASALAFDIFLFYLLWLRHLTFDQFHTNILGAADLHGMDPAELEQFWPAFLFQSSGRQFIDVMFAVPFFDQIHRWLLVPFRIFSEYFLLGTLVLCAAIPTAFREWRLHLPLFCWAICVCFMNVNYAVMGIEVYYVLLFLICGIWFAMGMSFILQALSRLETTLKRQFLFGSLCVLLLLLNPFSATWFPAQAVKWFPREGPYLANAALVRPSLKESYRALNTGREFVSFVPSNSLIYGPWQMQYVVEYVARIERGITTLDYYERTPFSASSQGFSRLYLQSIERQVRSRPVYFIGVPPTEVLKRYKVEDQGRSLYRVYSR